MTEQKGTRLSKVARELNVGITTIVEFLHKNGHNIDSNPNTKITDDCLDLLNREFQKDLSAKKESEKLGNIRKSREKKESITLDDVSKDETKQQDDDDNDGSDEMIHIQDFTSNKEADNHTHVKKKDVELKIVGKIDLNADKIKKAPIVTTEESIKHITEIHQNTKQNTESTPQKEVPTVQTTIEIHPKEETEIPVVVKVTEEKPEVHLTPAEEQKTEIIEKIENPVLNTSENETKPAKTDDTEIEQVSIKQNTDLKSTLELEEVKVDSTQTEPEIFRHKVTQLTGPTVIGRIELPQQNEKKKQPQQNQQSQAEQNKLNKSKRKKRKRIEAVNLKTENKQDNNHPKPEQPQNKEHVTNKNQEKPQNQSTAPKPQSSILSTLKKRDPNKPVTPQTNTNRGPGQQNRSNNDTRKKPNQNQRRDVHSPEVRKEVQAEDVDKQMKETLARLGNKIKSRAAKHRRLKRDQIEKKHQEQLEQEQMEKHKLKVTEFVSANELATMMEVSVNEVISTCMSLGLMVSINQRLDADTMSIVAEEFGYEVEFVSIEVQESIEEEIDAPESLISRPPIVTVMGHVDHGKTSLLDYIRKSNVIAGEAGGITQHIGAYKVQLNNGKNITFLDTPGHEAFTAMRARGASVTDIAIIVVAADDSVMPTTVEAINHAKAAQVPIVFAINKIDKPHADPEKIKNQLAQMNLLVEDWGGTYQSHDISAKAGLGVHELLDKVLLEAEILNLKANPDKKAVGTIIESSLDKGRGYQATLLISSGTLHVGDFVLAGSTSGRVKALYNERNQRIKSAGPSSPALIIGLDGAPQAGDNFNVMSNEREARSIAAKRQQLQREMGHRTRKHITLDEIGRRIAIGNFKELNVIVKGDVDGSIEALADSLIKLSTDQIQVNVIHKGVGQISENDVTLAQASDAVIIGFQVRPSGNARKHAEREGIEIRLYSIIYDAIDDLRDAMIGMLSPDIKEEIQGAAEVREVFNITKVGRIAGCMVREGKILRTSKVRVIRDGIVVFTGVLESLKRFKEDAKEARSGQDCGLNIERFNDIKVGDIIEAFTTSEIQRTSL